MQRITTAFAFLFLSTALWKNAQSDEGGTLNPEEMSFGSVMQKAIDGTVDMVTCASGYHITKAGRHEEAKLLFEKCAAAGYTGAMTWMSQLTNNGLGGPEDPKAAAAWDKRAAYAGDPVGKFNHGINLIRGHGIEINPELGRQFIDEAAKDGLDAAIRLKGVDYDLDEVTPDADNWKYQKIF